MKTLIILRHAKTEPHRPGDFDRVLVERGIEDARNMGMHAKALSLDIEDALASPAMRTRQTIALFGEGYGSAMPTAQFDETIYDASLSVLMNAIRRNGDSAKTLLVCGHNPSMQAIVLALSKGSGLLDKVREKFPTSAMAVIECNLRDWRDIADGCGTLVAFKTPRELGED